MQEKTYDIISIVEEKRNVCLCVVLISRNSSTMVIIFLDPFFFSRRGS